MPDLDTSGIRAQLTSHAMALGVFGQTLKHEPVSAPPSGVTLAVWAGRISPLPLGSGLAATTARLEFKAGAYLPADTEPMDGVDIQLTDAVDALLGAYNGDFTLGGLVRQIDVLGAYGEALQVVYRYTKFGSSSTVYRMADLTIPVIVNDVWAQSA